MHYSHSKEMIDISVIVPLYYGNEYISNIVGMIERNVINANIAGKTELVFVNDSPGSPIGFNIYDDDAIAIKIIENTANIGIHGARIKGLERAKGKYVMFLDMDDEISPNCFANTLSCIDNYDVVITNGISAGRKIYSSYKMMKTRLERATCLNGRNGIVSPGQMLLRKESIPEIWRKCVLTNNGADDYFLLLLLLINERRVYLLNKKLYRHVTTGSNAGKNNAKMHDSVVEMCDVLRKNGLLDDISYKNIIDHSKFYNNTDVLQRDQNYMYILDLWLELNEKNISVSSFFKERGIKKIVIYGAGVLGRHLIRQVHHTVMIEAVIDKNIYTDLGDDCDIPVVLPCCYVGDAEIMIVTPVVYFDEIKKDVKSYFNGEVIALDVILEGMVKDLD